VTWSKMPSDGPSVRRVTLHTFGRQKPFEMSEIDDDGIVLLLGKGRTYARLSWTAWSRSRRFCSAAGMGHSRWRAQHGRNAGDARPFT